MLGCWTSERFPRRGEQLWIVKPTASSQGRGIFILRNLVELLGDGSGTDGAPGDLRFTVGIGSWEHPPATKSCKNLGIYAADKINAPEGWSSPGRFLATAICGKNDGWNHRMSWPTADHPGNSVMGKNNQQGEVTKETSEEEWCWM